MSNLSSAILPIFLSLVLGYGCGRAFTPTLRTRIARLITPLVWLLLFSIGFKFGAVLREAAQLAHVLALAAQLALLTTIGPWFLIVLVTYSGSRRQPRAASTFAFRTILKPVKECAIALSMVVCGGVASATALPAALSLIPWPSTNILLFALVWLVGVSMVGVAISRNWLSASVLAIPMWVVLGSLAGGAIAALLTGLPLSVMLALSSGFGWFTLSGVLVEQHLGNVYGTVALFTDLFRELLAIVLIYGTGARYGRAAIGASGATALDSTLPMIKQACKAEELPVALVSGLVLSVAAPLMMTLFLA